ncbi:MAG: hypothetical protein SWH78_12730 [Thermodesulfobacteriota bacterium]|nr:hypothetical protein [Thermodesulfobacteriota bacterium]
MVTEVKGAFSAPECLKEQWSSDGITAAEVGCFQYPKVTSLVDKALDEKDPLVQKALLCKIDALITWLQPGTFLFHKTAIDVMSKRFKIHPPFSLTYEGIYRLRYASLNPD